MSLKVLIADPDWRFAAQATEYLESRAHLVVCQTVPAEAAAHARRWKPDLVILSCELANRGALEPMTAIKPRPAILLTGRMARYDLAWKAWQKGGDELLMKPLLRGEELHESIVTALEIRATGARRRRAPASA